MQAAAAKANFDKFTASLSNLGNQLSTVTKRVALLGAGLTAAAGGAGLAVFGLAKSAGEVADNAGKAAEATGLQVQAFTELQFAAEMANVGNDEFVAGMGRLNKAISDAASQTSKIGDAFNATGVKVTRFGGAAQKAVDATKQTGSVFDKLGVRIRDVNGNLRSNEAILLDVADAFARMPDSAQKSALAIELFGKSGANLLPFLNQAKAGITDLANQAERLGVVLTPAQAAIGDALGDSLDSVSKAAAGARLQLGLIFAPGLTVLANGLADIISQNRDLLIELGQAINQKVLGAVRDLLFLLAGRDDEVQSKWIVEWKDAIVQFGKDVYSVVTNVVIPLFKAISDGAKFVADQMNKFLGTDLTGGELLISAFILGIIGAFTLLGLAVGAVGTAIGILIDIFGGIPLLISAAIVGAGVALVAFWDEAKAGAAAGWGYIKDTATAAWQAIVDGVTGLWESIVGAFQEGQQSAVDAFNGIVEAIVEAWNGLVERLGAIAQQIVDRIAGWFGTLPQRISTIFEGIVSLAQSMLGRVSSLVDSIVSKVKSAIDYAKKLAGLGGDSGSSTGGGGGSQGGFAGGGFVSGRGGPKTDSILAWLSNGEFVIQAAAVKKLGVGFLSALNNGVTPSLKGLSGFSIGGFVDNMNRSMAIPRFAGGGSVSASLASSRASGNHRTPIILQLPGGEQIDDLTIGDIALNRLQRFLQREATASNGRRPR
ncbi:MULTISPECIES: hypothetical protein [unclassified Mesorhizobium]|uniref:hypothetical protein n=1 Tax=unclassified Mesorhizobium TaxID=325217 RepID=UPI001092545B|nr:MULTISPECIES: hypothetical protein [unclassified Mesorhizobium]TGQ01412.1 hypothetical protein EN861_01465 [Mesorhizobium sp. M8A.F.Ca.ET.218.01.1.1]